MKSDEIAEDYLRDDGMESEICSYLDTKILPLILSTSARRIKLIPFSVTLTNTSFTAPNSVNIYARSKSTTSDSATTGANLPLALMRFLIEFPAGAWAHESHAPTLLILTGKKFSIATKNDTLYSSFMNH